MIDLDEVSVSVGNVTLLAPLSATVDSGHVLVIRGRNGTGKSTLLRTMAGVRTPTSGTVRIDDDIVTERDRRFRRRVAAMIGLPPIAPDLTVEDHMLLVASTWLGDPRAATRFSRGVLEELGLTPLAARFPHELSSGQTQLLGLGLVLSRPFDVLIIDEPEQRLDPEHVDVVIGALRARRDSGATLVIATHSSRLAEELADHTLWLSEAA
ncbi:ABC transporter ATP-binding protein [Microbacterium xanthum]|uniref:ABC transporter ATP-binding protein n=1 Tax=Microbacterium xanthum TaxID=3079794 RepID=UPI002AD59292|nr:ABC transporter ATP-binding protein [Microbacterium sp. KSW-48]MDZ8171864.1 ABC transporter ATP-binding protein [Microbacterium sp. KSW-48]